MHRRLVLLALLGGTCRAGAMEAHVEPRLVDMSDPRRTYTRLPGKLDVVYESGIAGDPELLAASTAKLKRQLKEVFAVLPPHARLKLETTPFFLMWGARSPFGGQTGGYRYVLRKARLWWLDARWEGGIVIHSADNYVKASDFRTRKSLLHELAHAWQHTNWSPRQRAILQPYENALSRGLYRAITTADGRTVQKAYALKNAQEYFAEVSAAYFVGLQYFPYDRAGLMAYDPVGYRMVREMWGLAD